MNVVTLDIETTGLPPKDVNYETDYMLFPYIVSLAYKINGQETKHFIINQEGRKIPPEATAINKITDEIADSSPYKIVDVLRLLLSDSENTERTVGHNIYFDSSTIKANALREIKEGRGDQNLYELLQVLLHKDRRIDTMKSTIKFCNLPGKYGAKWPKLTELYLKLFNEEFNAHCSKDDVDATYRCFNALVENGVITLMKEEF